MPADRKAASAASALITVFASALITVFASALILLSVAVFIAAIVLACLKRWKPAILAWVASVVVCGVGIGIGIASVRTPTPRTVAVHTARAASRAKPHPDATPDRRPSMAADMQSVFSLLNSTDSGRLIVGDHVDHDGLLVEVDADTFGVLSDQDKTMMYQTIERAYTVTYRQHHGGKINKDLPIEFDDMAGTAIYHNMIYPDGS